MITIETELDSTVINIIDPKDGRELEVIAAAEGYYLRQYCEDMDSYDLIELSHEMLSMFMKALTLTDGVYQVEQ